MNANEASQKRYVDYLDNQGVVDSISGEMVYSVGERGVIIARGTSRKAIPWHRIVEVGYDNADTSFRHFFQGF